MLVNKNIDQKLSFGIDRWLHGIDFRAGSPTFGVCDRDYWAWKTKDFPNGTLQAGLFAFLEAKHLVGGADNYIKKVVSAVTSGTLCIQRKDGSFEEAYPLESSFAVTGLVLFNFSFCLLAHRKFFTEEAYSQAIQICEKATRFLESVPETHGVISNHLCTSFLGIDLYRKVRFNQDSLGQKTLEFLSLQTKEGWFPEYGGADPGYQTLLNHYMVSFLKVFPSEKVESALKRSMSFVSWFLYPDGDIGGEIGSRGTRICYVSGVPCSNWVESYYLSAGDYVNPINVDSGNFVPVLNSWAAFNSTLEYPLPEGLGVFTLANLIVFKGKRKVLALNLKNGTFILKEREASSLWKDYSVATFVQGDIYSQLGQASILDESRSGVSMRLSGRSLNQIEFTWVKSVILRIGASMLYYFPSGQRVLKKILAFFAMGNTGKLVDLGVTLDFSWTDSDVLIKVSKKDEVYRLSKGFYSHMASANTFVGVDCDPKI